MRHGRAAPLSGTLTYVDAPPPGEDAHADALAHTADLWRCPGTAARLWQPPEAEPGAERIGWPVAVYTGDLLVSTSLYRRSTGLY